MVGDREKALAAGCTGYIQKPINPETFMAEIEKIFMNTQDSSTGGGENEDYCCRR
jgi:CheY-like chemotaxis protein